MMNEKQILKHLSSSIEQAPIELLETIKAKPRVKQLQHDEITRQKRVMPSIKIMTAVASVFFLVAVFNIQLQYRTVDSRIYMDINPSLLIETNRQDNVIGMTALNPDGRALIEDYRFKGRSLDEVTVDLVDKLVLTNYISKPDILILVSVYNDNKEKANLQKSQIKDIIVAHLAPNNVHPVILTQAIDPSSTIKDMAAEYEISEGKMTLIDNLMNLSPKLKIEKLANMSLNQLIGLAKYMELDLSPVIEKIELDQIEVPDNIKDIYDDVNADADDDGDADADADADDDDDADADADDDADDDTTDSDDSDKDNNASDVKKNTEEVKKNTDKIKKDSEDVKRNVPTNSSSAEASTRLSATDARLAVTSKFGGIIEKIEYSYDDEEPFYKGEAIKEGSKVVFELNARTEVFTKWDTGNDNRWESFAEALSKMITMNQAADSVIIKSGISNTFVQKIDFKWDDDESIYQGEAFSEGMKYTFEINAFSGDFQKWDASSGE